VHESPIGTSRHLDAVRSLVAAGGIADRGQARTNQARPPESVLREQSFCRGEPNENPPLRPCYALLSHPLGAGIARRPAACFRQHQETRQRLIEQRGLLDIEDVIGLGKHREAGRRNGLFQKQARLDAGVVLIAGDDGREGIRRCPVFGVGQTSKRRPINSEFDPYRKWSLRTAPALL